MKQNNFIQEKKDFWWYKSTLVSQNVSFHACLKKDNWETRTISILYSISLTALKKELMWIDVCVQLSNIFTRRVTEVNQWISHSPCDVTASVCLLLFWLKQPKPHSETRLWCCFCGENKTSREQTWKICIVCTFLWSPVFSDPRSETHTHTLFILVKQATCFVTLCSTFALPEKFFFCFF